MNPINKNNVGRIAERIVSNELECLGFRVSDLNSDGTSANADLLAVGHGKTLQIQVKGATNAEKDKYWWIQYGYCTDEIINDRKKPMFNRRSSFYEADYVILVAVRSPHEYCCVVLRVEEAERIAQINIDRGYRTPKRDGTPKKPGKVWVRIDGSPNERKSSPLRDKERRILRRNKNKWGNLL
jgi:hypothetical protein